MRLQVKDCLEHNSSPVDGSMLCEILHHKFVCFVHFHHTPCSMCSYQILFRCSGINIRYLGTVTEIVSKIPQLPYLHVSEQVHSVLVLEDVLGYCNGIMFAEYLCTRTDDALRQARLPLVHPGRGDDVSCVGHQPLPQLLPRVVRKPQELHLAPDQEAESQDQQAPALRLWFVHGFL